MGLRRRKEERIIHLPRTDRALRRGGSRNLVPYAFSAIEPGAVMKHGGADGGIVGIAVGSVRLRMNKELIPHVFSSLHSLERYLENIRRLVAGNDGLDPKFANHIEVSLPEQERVLKQMRRVANKLQLEIAKEEWDAVIRSLRIFYGLNHMVRPDLINMFVKLSKGEQLLEDSSADRAPVGVQVH